MFCLGPSGSVLKLDGNLINLPAFFFFFATPPFLPGPLIMGFYYGDQCVIAQTRRPLGLLCPTVALLWALHMSHICLLHQWECRSLAVHAVRRHGKEKFLTYKSRAGSFRWHEHIIRTLTTEVAPFACATMFMCTKNWLTNIHHFLSKAPLWLNHLVWE